MRACAPAQGIEDASALTSAQHDAILSFIEHENNVVGEFLSDEGASLDASQKEIVNCMRCVCVCVCPFPSSSSSPPAAQMDRPTEASLNIDSI